MGDLPGKFPKRRASEDKARRKDSCWLVGTVVESDTQPLHIYSQHHACMLSLTCDDGDDVNDDVTYHACSFISFL